MDSTLSAAIEGLQLVFSWPNILYPILGTFLAMLASLVPGISGVTLMAMVIPATLYWQPLEIVLLFGALVGGATFMGSITAILVNIPGRNSNAATLLDGYPMSQRGEAKTAIACSATASAMGSTFGVIIFLLVLPFAIPAVKALGPIDIFMILAWGLSTSAMVIRGNRVKGLLMAALGLLISSVGRDQQTGEPRFTGGGTYLLDGIPAILIFLGVFALAEMMKLTWQQKHSVSGTLDVQELRGSAREGIFFSV